ncbi:P-II family nitrogen regulator [Halomonas sp. PAMB 3232]|uniref:P-II family nitrogen regulator n=1 Tax=Halomonas sp. PAMB 3232 TaxID=3075221 RepID=UPI0028A0F506|nr:P-II family nitrogen regulator [Halomonas sp. PAMB 3232]WNL37399.1 P-II family nitrogen regulator [Halomonas sp. PAMB 3232]
MRFKLIVALVEDALTDRVMNAAREAGATGATVINNARGEGRHQARGFLGIEITAQRDVLLFLVDAQKSRAVLDSIADAGEFDETPGTGIAFQVDVEEALGVQSQIQSLNERE